MQSFVYNSAQDNKKIRMLKKHFQLSSWSRSGQRKTAPKTIHLYLFSKDIRKGLHVCFANETQSQC